MVGTIYLIAIKIMPNRSFSPHTYTKDQLIRQPAIELFAERGWHVALPHPHPGPLPVVEVVIADDIAKRMGVSEKSVI